MSVEQAFPKVAYWSANICPLCGEKKPVIANGLITVGKDIKMCPDRGFSFCNCKNIWYTDWANHDAEAEEEPEQPIEVFQWHLNKENIKNEGYGRNRILICGNNGKKLKEEAERLGFDTKEHDRYDLIWSYHKIEHVDLPRKCLRQYYDMLEKGGRLFLATPDPFFIEFDNVYLWEHWKLREHHIMWDMDSLIDEIESVGFRVGMAMRNTEVKVNKDMHLVFKKVVEP